MHQFGLLCTVLVFLPARSAWIIVQRIPHAATKAYKKRLCWGIFPKRKDGQGMLVLFHRPNNAWKHNKWVYWVYDCAVYWVDQYAFHVTRKPFSTLDISQNRNRALGKALLQPLFKFLHLQKKQKSMRRGKQLTCNDQQSGKLDTVGEEWWRSKGNTMQ